MKTITAFELLLKCVKAREALVTSGLSDRSARHLAEKDAALDAAIGVLSSSIRRVMTPDEGDDTKEG